VGYDVHITRAAEWTDADADPITLEEWIAYVRSDEEMRLDGFAEASTTGGDVIRVESPGLAVWTAWTSVPDDDGLAWFDHRGGRIVVKSPDESILMKMCAIADRLGAHVQGDDGEPYTAADVPAIEASADEPEPRASRSWWRRLFGR
jgi:hypothetical protein